MILQEKTVGFEPKRALGFFEQICKIPHGSHNEEKIADYLQSFANMRGLYCYRDAKNNVLIKLPATEKYKDSPAYLIQGHTDMVCEKTSDSKHDFLHDPLDIYVEDGFLRARDTTLGADDGVAVAMMLAILDGELEEHPAIECLFTVEEETGLDGAEAFDYRRIDARRMINIDSDSENEVTAGCAGGVKSKVTYTLPTDKAQGKIVDLFVDGLFGGHSGIDINSGRANAIMLVIEMLDKISETQPIRLISLNGGEKDNAIPRFCRAIFCADDIGAVRRAVKHVEERVRPTLCEIDAGMTVSVNVLQGEKQAFSADDTRALLGLLTEVEVGVLKMSEDLEGLVEFSRNLGVIRVSGEGVNITYSPRSAKEEQIDLSIEQVERAAERVGAKVTHRSRYPGWDFAPESELRELYIRKCREKMGKDINTVVVHAGLECGIIKSRIPDMDAISIGPNNYNLHTPNEALDLASMARVFEVLKAVLTD